MAAIVISSLGFKGGTGKTTLVKNLGITLAKRDYRVLIIDLCQNSDVATRLGYDRETFNFDSLAWFAGRAEFKDVLQYDEETDIHFVPASKRVRQIIEHAETKHPKTKEFLLKNKIHEDIIHRFDFIFFDNHPDEQDDLNRYSLVASDLALIPTLMDISSIEGTLRAIRLVEVLQNQRVDIDYFVVPMAIDFAKGFGKELRQLTKELKELGVENITSPIRFSSAVPRQGLKSDVLGKDNKYIKKVMDDYEVLTDELLQMLDKVGARSGKGRHY